MTSLQSLPDNLPVPVDDGSSAHLIGAKLPALSLEATSGEFVKLNELSGTFVLYVYPMTGRPDTALPDNWDLIPGARGCTPQACSYRDHYAELRDLGSSVYALSTQSTEYQKEMASRLHLPFPVLSDVNLKFATLLRMPTFVVQCMTLLKRITLVCKEAEIIRVHYPVFPPDKDIDWVISTLRSLK
jgi:peroxiredoxin